MIGQRGAVIIPRGQEPNSPLQPANVTTTAKALEKLEAVLSEDKLNVGDSLTGLHNHQMNAVIPQILECPLRHVKRYYKALMAHRSLLLEPNLRRKQVHPNCQAMKKDT